MRHLLKSLVVGAVAVSASNAFAGGLPQSTGDTSGTSASASALASVCVSQIQYHKKKRKSVSV